MPLVVQPLDLFCAGLLPLAIDVLIEVSFNGQPGSCGGPSILESLFLRKFARRER